MVQDYSDFSCTLTEEASQIEKKWYDMGFREGVLKGKADTGQKAFDIGFHIGALNGLLKEINNILPSDLKRNLEFKLDQLKDEFIS
jgi:hypothetical protein